MGFEVALTKQEEEKQEQRRRKKANVEIGSRIVWQKNLDQITRIRKKKNAKN